MGNQWGDIYLCVPQPKCWGDVSPRPPIIAAPGGLDSILGANSIFRKQCRNQDLEVGGIGALLVAHYEYLAAKPCTILCI